MTKHVPSTDWMLRQALGPLEALVLCSAMGAASAGCGARSELGLPDGTGGGGAGGGGAAAIVPCEGPPGLVEPILEIGDDEAYYTLEPELAVTSDDGAQVAYAVRRVLGGGQNPYFMVRHGAFFPWSDWPAEGPLFAPHETFVSTELVEPFRLADAPGEAMAMLVGYSLNSSMALHVDPLAPGESPTFTPPGIVPVFLAHNGSSWLAGTTEGGRLVVSLIREQGGAIEMETHIPACSVHGVVADAVPYGDGYLLMTSNGIENPPGECLDLETAGSPSRIDVLRILPGAPPAFHVGVSHDIAVSALSAAPHPDGAWLVYQVIQGEYRPLLAERFDLPGLATYSMGEITSASEAPFEHVTTSLGRRLVVAWKNQPFSGPWDILVRSIDELGEETATVAIPGPALTVGPRSILGSAKQGSVIVSWEGGNPVRGKLAKVCLGAGE